MFSVETPPGTGGMNASDCCAGVECKESGGSAFCYLMHELPVSLLLSVRETESLKVIASNRMA